MRLPKVRAVSSHVISAPANSSRAPHFSWWWRCGSRQRQDNESARRRLALWTEIAASTRYNPSPDDSPAPMAAFSLPAVSPVPALIFSRLAFRVEKVGNRGTTHGDGLAQDCL